jgi:DNA-binding transcriptional regulator YiaG
MGQDAAGPAPENKGGNETTEPVRPTPTGDVALLREAIKMSKLSTSRFAETVLARESRTVRRWLAGQPIPRQAKAFLEAYLQKRVRKPQPVEMEK